jgi:AcrR family transcriptional regulator
VHHHFHSKEELLLAVIARRDKELLAGYEMDLVEARFDPDASAARWQKLHGDAPHEVALRLELRSLAFRSEAVRRELVQVDETAAEATAARLAKDAADQGLVWRHPPQVVSALLHAASHAAAERAALTDESSERLMAAFMDLVWNGALEARKGEG